MRDGFISDLVSKWGVCFGVREALFSPGKFDLLTVSTYLVLGMRTYSIIYIYISHGSKYHCKVFSHNMKH